MTYTANWSLRLRLFAVLALFAAAIILALAAILSASGVFATGMNESRILLQNELDHLSGKAMASYGSLTAEGITLSDRLTARIGEVLDTKGLSAAELKSHPELLTDVLRECIDPALAALERNRASGVFIILDATVNPDTNSRAGFFFRNMEPNALTYSKPSLYYMRGPIALARERDFFVLPQWLMEFPVKPGDFFHKALAGAKGSLPPARTHSNVRTYSNSVSPVKRSNNSLPASRTYYWNTTETLVGDYDAAMLLCVPMPAPDGTVWGICGFEVNELLFKMQYLPDTSVFSGATVVFAPVTEGGALNTDAAMFSCTIPLHTNGLLTVSDYRHGLQAYESDGKRYIGLSAPISLYSKNTAHSGEWRLAAFVPESELAAYADGKSRGITILLLILFVCAIGLAVFLSKRYLAPVLKGFEQIKQGGAEDFRPTYVPEIDDLLVYLADLDSEHRARGEEAARLAAELEEARRQAADATMDVRKTPSAAVMAYERFLQNLETLTATERTVFDLYLDGKTAQEISSELFITISTVKYHNGNLYKKLGVSSLKELRVYMGMMT